jgi:FkbM family methyltransferase
MISTLRALRARLPIVAALHGVLREPYYRMMTAAHPRGAATTLSGGIPVRVHPRFLGLRPDLYEPELANILRQAIPVGGVVLDIGAHVGLHTLMFSKTAGKDGKVIAAEPSPANAGLLRKHLEWNDCANVTVVDAAVSDQEGTAQFTFRAEATDFGGFANSLAYDNGGETREVRLTTIDALCGDLNPDLIKIDVEGAELSVLRGGDTVLRRANPVLVVAIHPGPMQSMGTTPAQLVAHLEALGYVGYDLDGKRSVDPGSEEIVFRRPLAS